VVDILLDGGALLSVGVRNRKRLLPSQLTNNMKILNKLSVAERLCHRQQSKAATTSRVNVVSLSSVYKYCGPPPPRVVTFLCPVCQLIKLQEGWCNNRAAGELLWFLGSRLPRLFFLGFAGRVVAGDCV